MEKKWPEFLKPVLQHVEAKPVNLFIVLFICVLIFLFFPAGVFCAIVSHPADTVVSKLNNDVGSTPIQAARELGMKGRNSK